MTETVLVSETPPAVIVSEAVTSIVTVEETPRTAIIENDLTSVVTVVAQGPQGPRGPQGEPGENKIAGYSVSVTGLGVGDLLAFGGTQWINSKQDLITDGGNF